MSQSDDALYSRTRTSLVMTDSSNIVAQVVLIFIPAVLQLPGRFPEELMQYTVPGVLSRHRVQVGLLVLVSNPQG